MREEPRPGVESRGDDLPGQGGVRAERVPGTESDDRPEAALLHQAARAASTSARVTSTIPSRSSTEIRSSMP